MNYKNQILICVLSICLGIIITLCVTRLFSKFGAEGTGGFEASKLEFNHVGLVTDEVKQGESFVAATKVWVTNPHEHPYKIEWLRYEPDSSVTGPVRTQPHIAFRVESLEEASKGLKVLLEPFDVGFATVGFWQTSDEVVVELMEYKQGRDWQPK